MLAKTPPLSCLLANIIFMATERDFALFEPTIEELWNLEATEIKSMGKQKRDDLAIQMLKNRITKEDRIYQVSWPWRN